MVTFTKLPATAALVEPTAPPWAQRMVLRMLGVWQPVTPVQPNLIWYANKADLPPAAQWPWALVAVADQAELALSVGGVWRVVSVGGPV